MAHETRVCIESLLVVTCYALDLLSDVILFLFAVYIQMTPEELKFALQLESKLNSLPDPEYRQLVVEVLMVVSLVAKASTQQVFGHHPLVVDHIIEHARHLFLQDQVRM